jgi:small GTP-binding protein
VDFALSEQALVGVRVVVLTGAAKEMVEVDSSTLVRLQLWDIAGQERFGSMTRVYYRDADAAVIMFDLTAQRTFEAVAKWRADVDDKVLLESGQPVPCLLLGNKSDLPGRTISDDEIDAFCKQAGFIGYHAVSAKTAEKVEDAMMHLLRYLLSTSAAPAAPEADSFRLGDDDGLPEKKSGCCGD